ncbi:MAG: YkgJ family cysteine cluster protein [Deltaproteobacteria bacterium]|nr:YkgJ family cysteine cluster protein [Deltaproteobacteria bacterium]
MSTPAPPLSFDAAADAAGEAVEEALSVVVRSAARSPDPERAVRDGMPRVHRRLQVFVERTFAANPERPVHCKAGCATCCHQWVHDVRAHEIDALGRHLVKAGDGESVQDALQERLTAYRALERRHPDSGREADPQLTRALAYLEQGRPCVFLDEAGGCRVYALRPWVCRTYFSLAPPERCRAEALRSGAGRGLFLEPFSGVDEALDAAAAPFAEPGYTGELVRDLLTWLSGPRRGGAPSARRSSPRSRGRAR